MGYCDRLVDNIGNTVTDNAGNPVFAGHCIEALHGVVVATLLKIEEIASVLAQPFQLVPAFADVGSLSELEVQSYALSDSLLVLPYSVLAEENDLDSLLDSKSQHYNVEVGVQDRWGLTVVELPM